MKAIRIVLVVLGVFALVWLCAIGYWHVRDVTPGGGLLLGWLLVAPSVALLALWAGVRWRRARRDRVPDATPEVPPADGDAPAAAPVQCARIAAAALHLPPGADVEAILAPGVPSPGLHPTLRDRDGLPVFAAFVRDLDTGAIADALDAADAGHAPPEEGLRALALLEPVADALLLAATTAMPAPAEADYVVNAGLQRRLPGEAGDALRISLLLPAAWPDAPRAAAADWLHARAVETGVDGRRLRVDTHALRTPDDGWRFVEAVLAEARPQSEWRLLLACDSLIGARAIARLDAAAGLLRSQRPEGVVPGEGAAGVLLPPPGALGEAAGAVAVHGPCRGEPVRGAPARAAARETADLVRHALAAAAIDPDAVVQAVSDADQHRTRALHAVAAVAEACPELDVALRHRGLGAVAGELGAAMPLALLAAAAGAAAATHSAVLALSVAGERHRAFVVDPGHAAASVPDDPASPVSS
ncbi:hypothetical protein [Luteimonas sp. FCS-9]|uniref:hypothetical protein n=1 Tax=Luteimonas sp. FCS-9 TaxID=1547516 RepID=UPI00069C3DB6|nr:hypothetical protein [Luteimonas sp. FCS-9]